MPEESHISVSMAMGKPWDKKYRVWSGSQILSGWVAGYKEN